jgi:hypothetical protein
LVGKFLSRVTAVTTRSADVHFRRLSSVGFSVESPRWIELLRDFIWPKKWPLYLWSGCFEKWEVKKVYELFNVNLMMGF